MWFPSQHITSRDKACLSSEAERIYLPANTWTKVAFRNTDLTGACLDFAADVVQLLAGRQLTRTLAVL
jgi:hypothetical protein